MAFSYLLTEFAKTMCLLTGHLGIFDKAIREDPVSQAMAQPKFNLFYLFKCYNELCHFLTDCF